MLSRYERVLESWAVSLQTKDGQRRRLALFVIHYPAFGGPHNRVLRIAQPLHAVGWDCAVVLPDEPGNAVPWLRSGDVPVIEQPLGRVRRIGSPLPNMRMLAAAPREIAGLREVIREWDPDVVVVGNLVMPHAAIAAHLERCPVLWQIVDTAVPKVLRWSSCHLYDDGLMRWRMEARSFDTNTSGLLVYLSRGM